MSAATPPAAPTASLDAAVPPAATAPPPRPRAGPVLIGDLAASAGGRPLLLWHWLGPPPGPG